nr:GtrA family protein [Streptomyces sp. MA5143a]
MEHSARQLPEPTRPLSSFMRFVACGGGVGVLSSGAVALLAALLPWAVANAVVTVVSTVLATELHARFTFGAGRRAGRREHLQSAGSAAAAYGVTCAATAVLHLVHSAPGLLVEQAVYLGASALAGVGRFVVLRVVVFAAGKPAGAANTPLTAPARTVPAPRRTAPPVSRAWYEWIDDVPLAHRKWIPADTWAPCPAG